MLETTCKGSDLGSAAAMMMLNRRACMQLHGAIERLSRESPLLPSFTSCPLDHVVSRLCTGFVVVDGVRVEVNGEARAAGDGGEESQGSPRRPGAMVLKMTTCLHAATRGDREAVA
jgi:hypothetical protein